MDLAQAVKIVADDRRRSYPKMSDVRAVAYTRDMLMLPGTGFDSRWEIERNHDIDPEFDAHEMVLKADQADIDALLGPAPAESYDDDED